MTLPERQSVSQNPAHVSVQSSHDLPFEFYSTCFANLTATAQLESYMNGVEIGPERADEAITPAGKRGGDQSRWLGLTRNWNQTCFLNDPDKVLFLFTLPCKLSVNSHAWSPRSVACKLRSQSCNLQCFQHALLLVCQAHGKGSVRPSRRPSYLLFIPAAVGAVLAGCQDKVNGGPIEVEVPQRSNWHFCV